MAKVLFIEDDATVQRALSRVLKHHELTIVDRGTEAIVLLAENEYDLIISDYDLKGNLTGEDVYLWVRNERPHMASRYVFCAGSSRAETLCQAEGIPYVEKPYTITDLRRAVESKTEVRL